VTEINWRSADEHMIADVDDVKLTAYNPINQSAWNVVAKRPAFEVDYDDVKRQRIQEVEVTMKVVAQGADTESLNSVGQRALDALEGMRRRLETDVTTVGV